MIQNISRESLSFLLKELSLALLDQRVASIAASSKNGLEEETSKKLQNDLNRLAIRAGINSPPDIALAVLMDLQLQYCVSFSIEMNTERINMSKLKRMTAKLFAKVVKAEETSPACSFESSLPNYLCTIESYLSAVQEARDENNGLTDFTACLELVKILCSAIVKSKGPRCLEIIELSANTSGILWEKSQIRNMFISLYSESFGNCHETACEETPRESPTR